jgi:hypothetical protein
MKRTEQEITITSKAGPTWKLIFAVSKEGGPDRPGGGIAKALFIPATSKESHVRSDSPKMYGLDDLEWRFIRDGKGVRSPMGTAVLDGIRVKKQSGKEIVLAIDGHWENISRFTKTITVNPLGYQARIEAEWAGPTEFRSMWWMISHLRGALVDNEKYTVKDTDSASVPLPALHEKVIPLPDGIAFPYEVSMPLKSAPGRALKLTVRSFATTDASALRYELWPVGKDGFFSFFPRYVNKEMPKGTHVFDYEWRFGG